MSQSWLHRQKKQILLDLSTAAGLPQDEDLRKDDLVEKLSEHLQANATRFQGNPAFDGYFGTRRTPSKPRESTAVASASSDDPEAKPAAKPRVRKSAKVKDESEESGGVLSSPARAGKAIVDTLKSISPKAASAIASASSRTPAPKPRRQSQLPGPPSPSVLANVVEQESSKLAAGVQDLISVSGIPEGIEQLRDSLSSVASIQLTFLLLEAVALQRKLIPWRFAFNTLAVAPLRIPSFAVYLPDLFMLVTGTYWSTTLLWLSTSVFVPVLFAYFFNLTVREKKRGAAHVHVARYTADPVTYNIVKALAAYLVYGHGVTFGIVDYHAARRVNDAIFGGHNGIVIGAGIGIVAALYEATLRKAV